MKRMLNLLLNRLFIRSSEFCKRWGITNLATVYIKVKITPEIRPVSDARKSLELVCEPHKLTQIDPHGAILKPQGNPEPFINKGLNI
jgi:hypothetical protein